MSGKERPEADEIEVTSEMIAAGLRELPPLWSEYEDAEAAVVRVYRAMANAAGAG